MNSATGDDFFKLNSTSFEIARLIHGYLTKKRKGWSLISQAWILDCLEKWYGCKIERSTLNYNLAILRRKGYIETRTRHRRNPETGAFEPRVTLYCMTFKLKALFMRLVTYFKGIGWGRRLREIKELITPEPAKHARVDEWVQKNGPIRGPSEARKALGW